MHSPKTITTRILLQHIQELAQRMAEGFAKVDTRFERLEKKVDRHYILLSTQINAIDKRLDAVEVAGVR